MNGGIAPAEIFFRMAHYESCLPSQNDNNVTVDLAVEPQRLSQIPRPVWSAARVSKIWEDGWYAKFLCDPMACDRMAIHYADTKFCDRYSSKAAAWEYNCTKIYVPEDRAIVHHARVFDKNHQIASPRCNQVEGVHELDWSFTNFVAKRFAAGV